MLILPQTIEVKWTHKERKHYENLGYIFTKYGDVLIISVEDLPKGSSKKVNVLCDYCFDDGIVNIIKKKYVKLLKSREIIQKDCCDSCRSKKTKDVNNILYGVDNVFQLEHIKDKSKNTIKNKYGVDHTSKNKDISLRISTSNTYSYEYIKGFIEENSNCSLLSLTYSRSTDILFLSCECGETFETSFINFKHENKRQCDECGLKKRSGENHPNWRGGTTPENEQIRHSKEYIEWREDVYRKDNYTCQCCLDNTGGNLHAHHINNFAEHKDLRFDVSNGITLCSNCHSPNIIGSFHHTYGTKNNNLEQLTEYINRRRNELNIKIPFELN